MKCRLAAQPVDRVTDLSHDQLGIDYQYQAGIHTLTLVKQVTDSEYVNGLGSAAV